MNPCTTPRTIPIAAAALSALLSGLDCIGGGPSEPTAPTPPRGEGGLFFLDSGCACAPKPWTPIDIFVDGELSGQLPVLGQLSLFLPAGEHTWSDLGAEVPNATRVDIRPSRMVTVNIQTNYGCVQDCTCGCSAGLDAVAI
jgi:hypothetical protein